MLPRCPNTNWAWGSTNQPCLPLGMVRPYSTDRLCSLARYSAAGNGSPRHYPPQRSAPAAVFFPPESCPGRQTAGCIPSVLPGYTHVYPRAVAMMGRPALRSSATSPTMVCRVTFSRLDSSTPVTGAVAFLKIFGNKLCNSMIISYLFRINLNSAKLYMIYILYSFAKQLS